MSWFCSFRRIGPGVVTGASDDDPSGIGTYAQAGALFGVSMLWFALFTTPLMVAVQEICARIGIVTKKGIVANLVRHSPRWLVLIVVGLVVIANIFNVSADLSIMSEVVRLMLPVPVLWSLIFFAVITMVLEVFLTYRVYANYLKWLTIFLLAYVAVVFFLRVDWQAAVWATLIPSIRLTKEYLLMVVAFFGTTISPYLFFWQANEEVEEGLLLPRTPVKRRLREMRTDTAAGMLYSNVIAWFIIVVAANTFGTQGIHTIASADQAAMMLRPLAGAYASTLFAIGIIGAGLLAVPILTGVVAYTVCEAWGCPEGLSKKWDQARIFYLVILISLLGGLLLNIFGMNPIKMLVYAAVCNGLAAVPLLFVILRLASKKTVMGPYVIHGWVRVFGWATFVIMTLVGVGYVIL